MTLYLDIQQRRFVRSLSSQVPLTSLVLKRREIVPVDVVFCDGGEVASGTLQFMAIKEGFGSPGFVAVYDAGYLNLYTNEIDALFAGDTNCVNVYLEAKWGDGESEEHTATLVVELQNSVILDEGGSPTPLPSMKATQADAETGTNNEKWMTPLRTAQAIAKRATSALLDGLSTASGVVVTASDTILAAIGKLQKQASDTLASVNLKEDKLVPTVLTPSGNYQLAAPSVASAGVRKKYYIVPTSNITFTLNAAIKIPSDSSFTSKSLTSGKRTIVQLESDGNGWMLTTLVGEF